MELRFDNLSYTYRKGNTNALEGIDACFTAGIHLLLGPNGAGKSTMLKVAAGLLVPQSGKCFLDKEVMACHSPHAVKNIFLLEDDCRFPLSTINEMVRRHAPFYVNFSREILDVALSTFGMSGDEPLAEMSLGDRHKANVAYVLAMNTPVLLLDEPANGLDMLAKQNLSKLLARFSDDRCIIVATHTVQEMRNLFDSVTILNHGRVIVNASTDLITERLAFISDTTVKDEALGYYPTVDGPNQVVPNDGSFDTPIDYTLLFLAAIGDKLEILKNILR